MNTIVLHTPDYKDLGASIAQGLGAGQASLERKQFPDGEIYLRTQPVAGAHVVLVGGTQTADNLVELITLGQHAAKNGARRLSFIIPYFGYSTMERAKVAGEVIRAKANAAMLSAIPNPPEGKHFFLLDLHAAGITEYFEGGCHVEHVYAMGGIIQKIREITQNEALIVGSADTGRVDWVASYARELGCDLAVITKRRLDGETVELLAVSGSSVQGKTVIIYDDMIRSGGTIVKAVKAYRDAGANRIIVATSHLVLTAAADRTAILTKLFLGGVSDLITTNSLPQAKNQSDWYVNLLEKSRYLSADEVQRAQSQIKALHIVDVTPAFLQALNTGNPS